METPLTEASIAERYRRVADRFAEVAAGVKDWDAPTPVAEWRARDVVDHLVTWFPPMLANGAPVQLETTRSAQEDPVGAWADLDSQLRTLLDDPATAELEHSDEHTGNTPVPTMIDRFFTADVFMHTWDLARSSGQDDRLDEGMVSDLLGGMQAMADVIRSSGHYGEQQPVPDDADDQERLIAFIGRNPRWTPPPR